jgi:hypothetical protein
LASTFPTSVFAPARRPFLIRFQAIPIALRVIYRDKFVRGPFHLGAFSYPVALTAVVWIAFISIAFILPQVNVRYYTLHGSIHMLITSPARHLANVQLLHRALCPFFNSALSFTFTSLQVAVGIVIFYSVGFWLISARKWFTGPVKQIAGTAVLLTNMNFIQPF